MMRLTAVQRWPELAKAPCTASARRLLQVGVGEHDQRVVAAELQHGTAVAQARGDRLADRDAPRERDHLDRGVARNRVEDLARIAADDLADSAGSAGLRQDSSSAQRAQRRLLRRLDHDRRAHGKRRRHLVGDLVERMVEGRDGGDEPHRNPQGVGAAVAAVRRDVPGEALAVVAQRLHRGEAEHVDRAPDLMAGVLQAQARLGADQARELLAPRAEQARDAEQDFGALVARSRPERRAPAASSARALRRDRPGRLADELAGVGGADREHGESVVMRHQAAAR